MSHGATATPVRSKHYDEGSQEDFIRIHQENQPLEDFEDED